MLRISCVLSEWRLHKGLKSSRRCLIFWPTMRATFHYHSLLQFNSLDFSSLASISQVKGLQQAFRPFSYQRISLRITKQLDFPNFSPLRYDCPLPFDTCVLTRTWSVNKTVNTLRPQSTKKLQCYVDHLSLPFRDLLEGAEGKIKQPILGPCSHWLVKFLDWSPAPVAQQFPAVTMHLGRGHGNAFVPVLNWSTASTPRASRFKCQGCDACCHLRKAQILNMSGTNSHLIYARERNLHCNHRIPQSHSTLTLLRTLATAIEQIIYSTRRSPSTALCDIENS